MRFIWNALRCVLILAFSLQAVATPGPVVGNTSGVNASNEWIVNHVTQEQLNIHFIEVSCFPLALQTTVLASSLTAAMILFRYHESDDDPWNAIGFGYKAMAAFSVGYLSKVIDSVNSCISAGIFGYFPYGSYGHHPTKKELAAQSGA